MTRPAKAGIAFSEKLVLVVEDHEVNRFVTCQYLKRLGCNMVLAHDGSQAVSLCRETRFDLILMDLQMPNMDGFEATRRIRAASNCNATCPIIAITADITPERYEKCLAAGINDLIVKPIAKNALCKVMAKHLHAPGNPSRIPPSTEPGNKSGQAHLVLDWERLLEEFDGNAREALDALHTLAPRLREDYQNLESALTGQDRENVRKKAHRIRGAAMQFAALRLASAAAELELLSECGEWTPIGASVERLAMQFQVLFQEIEFLQNKKSISHRGAKARS